MTSSGEQILLRIYLQSANRTPHIPTYQRLVKVARHDGLAGATVLQGILGTGSRGPIQQSAWALVQHVPVIVEIVDVPERIAKFVNQSLPQHLAGGLVTLERAHVMMYRPRMADKSHPLRLGDALPPLSTVPQIQPRPDMTINEQGVLLRVFIGESDRFEQAPLYEAIVRKVRALGLSGATVLRGSEGFGANSVVHKSRLLELSTDLPIVIEIVDTDEKIKLLLPHLDSMVQEGMITMEHVTILMYRHS